MARPGASGSDRCHQLLDGTKRGLDGWIVAGHHRKPRLMTSQESGSLRIMWLAVVMPASVLAGACASWLCGILGAGGAAALGAGGTAFLGMATVGVAVVALLST